MADGTSHEDPTEGQKNEDTSLNKRQKKKKRKEKEWEEINRLIEVTKSDFDATEFSSFDDYPISNRTKKGLEKAGFSSPTEIQEQGVSLGLKGHDLLGAAKTGSGKTLAFLIPVIELLWREKWSKIHGLGALIITPTRELAYQIFEVLKKIGFLHDFSAGLVIGGKDMKEESERILDTNIIICTPGRLLQHMDETPNFDCTNLKILVLDEADRILDLGFAKSMNAIVENLPEERQTLLYSATQTKSVKDLARLSLTDPQYVAVHEQEEHSTPQNLSQCYMVCELQDKFNFIYSFVKNHLKFKTLVFLSSCKQVKFTYEAIRRLQPGVPLMALYGKQNQMKRVGIYEEFCRKKFSVLFATDIAARGLDFPSVDWVIQLDCPEDANTYIHRAGRTARYNRNGQALLVLLPSEEKGMMKQLKEKRIPLEVIRPNTKKIQDMSRKLQAFCAQNQDVKHWAQKSIISYVRSVFLQSNKEVFDIHSLPVSEYATSLGLLVPPRIRFMQKLEKKMGAVQTKSKSRDQITRDSLSIRQGLTKDPSNRVPQQADDEEDILVVKKRGVHMDLPEISETPDEIIPRNKQTKQRNQSKTALAKKLIRKNIKMNSKVVFDEEGEVDESKSTDLRNDQGDDAEYTVEKAIQRMKTQDEVDRQVEREKLKVRRQEKRRKLKGKQKESTGASVQLETAEDSDDNDSYEEEAFEEPQEKKRKNEPSNTRDDDEDNDSLDEITHDEELALQLLSGGT